MRYDIVGDVHGQCGKLDALLQKLGYTQTAGVWRHSERQVIFVGDFIDRGPEQLRSVNTARSMVDAGSALAIMGNHELNAIAWHTPKPCHPGQYLRPHDGELGKKNRRQHTAFLAEVEDKPALHAEIIDWFLSLPLWLDLPDLRIVHACWNPPFVDWVTGFLHEGRYLTRDLMIAATDECDAERDNAVPSIFKVVECLTKGIEIPLPAPHQFLDNDGHPRDRVRVRWWVEGATTYPKAAMLSPSQCANLPDLPIPEHARIARPDDKPVLFGHYWLTGNPLLESARATCVDYSAGKGGPLVAYCFDGEPDLLAEHLVWVD